MPNFTPHPSSLILYPSFIPYPLPLKLMIYDLSLSWRNVRTRKVQTAITILVVGLAIGLFVTVSVLGDAIRRGVVQASDPFGVLVVGAKGSGQQLVLSTILLQGPPVGNIPIHIYEELQADERVALAVPLAMGDNVGGARVIGTNEDFFRLTGLERETPPFVVTNGRAFTADFEAVLGATAARELGLTIGDAFITSHGVERVFETDEHAIPFTVVGILEPTSSPYDGAVFTTIPSIWAVHEEEGTHEEAAENSAEEEDHHTAESGQVTAILVKPVNFAVTNSIWQGFYTGTEAQAAFPGQELGGLFDQLRQGERVLTAVGYLAAVMAALTVLLAIYSATIAREQTIAIMRSLGASRVSVLRMVIFEALIISLVGAIFGRVVGYATAWLIAHNITAQAAVPVQIHYLFAIEPFLWLLPLVLAVAAGLYPALMAYRVDVVEKLFPG